MLPATRDRLASRFRAKLYARLNFIPFPHQAEWQLASEGWTLEPIRVRSHGDYTKANHKRVKVLLPDKTVATYRAVRRAAGPARVLDELAAFKSGKSKGSAMWLTGFAAPPGARITLLGVEYDTCVPEFEYLSEALLSSIGGIGLRARRYYNQPKAGRMLIELQNGTRFECRSWDRKDSLRGKEIDVYLACEGYQFPGPEVFTSISQNLRKRDGIFVLTTTPDRPWVSLFHEEGHGKRPDWHCTCSIPAEANPFTFDQKAKDRDDPEKGGLMTREAFAKAWLGKLGEYIGRVYQFQRGERQFSPDSAPQLWNLKKLVGADAPSPEHLVLPPEMDFLASADTGTFMSALLAVFDTDGWAWVLEEFPNYRYVATVPELLNLSVPEWTKLVVERIRHYRTRTNAWADANTQFRQEVRRYGLHLLSNLVGPEARTEISREYFQQHHIHLAPWLRILPYELEIAVWPTEATSAGRFERVKRHDHTLVCLEHILSRRPRGRAAKPGKQPTFLEQYLRENAVHRQPRVDPHLGAN